MNLDQLTEICAMFGCLAISPGFVPPVVHSPVVVARLDPWAVIRAGLLRA